MPPAIHVASLRKSYAGTLAVDDVSFDVQPGEIFGLIGPNGAGKTTTMECVEGLRAADGGVISVLGLDPRRDAYALQERIGVQLQEAQLQKRIKVREAVALWASLYRTPVDGGRLIEQLGLQDKRNAWFMTLSGGQKQRLFIGLALINDPELVFLDELTTGLDPQARRAIWDLVRSIRQRGKTVFLTTHLMEEAERLCDRVAIIDHGRIVDIGTPGELVQRHCPERTVILATGTEGAADRFRAIPGVGSIAGESGRLIVRGAGHDLVTEVIQCIAEHRIRDSRFPHRTADARGRLSEADRPRDSRLTGGGPHAARTLETDLARDQDIRARAARRIWHRRGARPDFHLVRPAGREAH